MTTKPKPIIQKITFTPEEEQDIKNIPQKGKINKYDKHPVSTEYKIKLVKQFYGGYCHVCMGWPSYKVTYDMNGAQLKEFYCDKCMPKEYS